MFIFIKKIIPTDFFNFLQPYYHKVLAYTAAFFYGYPSNKIIVIGVTGTNGKSTTTHLIAKALEVDGDKTGETSTVFFKIGDKEWLNDKKMTMLGRFSLQKIIHKAVRVGCKYIVIETSSEGIKQFRHLGVNYDTLVFTNLTPEHIESHGGFENYKKAKLSLFKHLEKSKKKTINKKEVDKTIIVNLDDEHAADFLNFNVDRKIGITTKNKKSDLVDLIFSGSNIKTSSNGISFNVENKTINLKLVGEFNVYNSLSTIGVCDSYGIKVNKTKKALENISGVAGRMEYIDGGQKFDVVVDYSPEPESLKQAYSAILKTRKSSSRIIHVLGSCGGGRDVARRPILGSIAGKNADYIIVTNEDPYDDDPQEIIDDVSSGAIKTGKKIGIDLFNIIDRRDAIKKALSLARDNDIVFITGKGSEQAICIDNGKQIPWDDRVVVREELDKTESTTSSNSGGCSDCSCGGMCG